MATKPPSYGERENDMTNNHVGRFRGAVALLALAASACASSPPPTQEDLDTIKALTAGQWEIASVSFLDPRDDKHPIRNHSDNLFANGAFHFEFALQSYGVELSAIAVRDTGYSALRGERSPLWRFVIRGRRLNGYPEKEYSDNQGVLTEDGQHLEITKSYDYGTYGTMETWKMVRSQ
jgi:hypothetical protein